LPLSRSTQIPNWNPPSFGASTRYAPYRGWTLQNDQMDIDHLLSHR
jgi:hypothetical protein